MGHQLWIVFNWPNGIVVGNLLASLIWVTCATLGIVLFRDRLGPHVAAWFHKHHTAHLEKLRGDSERPRL